jgi:hypothetical protein
VAHAIQASLSAFDNEVYKLKIRHLTLDSIRRTRDVNKHLYSPFAKDCRALQHGDRGCLKKNPSFTYFEPINPIYGVRQGIISPLFVGLQFQEAKLSPLNALIDQTIFQLLSIFPSNLQFVLKKHVSSIALVVLYKPRQERRAKAALYSLLNTVHLDQTLRK